MNKMMTQLTIGTRGALAFILLTISPACATLIEPYDIVIQGGRVMDPESGFDAVANIGIRGEHIAIITQRPIDGVMMIDAAKHVVAPGFIDTHYHGTLPLHYRLALRNGVTTVMDLEFGTLGTRVEEWYAAREGRSLINFGTASSHELARASVLDGVDAIDTSQAANSRRAPNWSGLAPNAQQSASILGVIDAGLAAGAIGVGSTLGYMPGADAQELFDIQALSASYGRQISVHLRHTPGTPTNEINGAQEVLANAVALDAPVMINHFNNPGWRMVYDLLRRLQANGHNVWGEIYPYAVGSTSINAVFLEPDNWRDRLGKRYEETIYDPIANTFLSEASFLALRSKHPVHPILIHKMAEREVPNWLGLEGTTIASDGLPDLNFRPLNTPLETLPNAHPRAAGSYAKALRLAREHEIDLMSVLRQTSYTTAKHLGETGLASMQNRGRLAEGAIADIVLFNPETVRDNATYTQGTLPATGFKAVLVAGEIVLSDDAVILSAKPGRAIRFER